MVEIVGGNHLFKIRQLLIVIAAITFCAHDLSAVENQSYIPIADFGQNCEASFGKDDLIGKALVNQVFVTNASSKKNDPMSFRSMQNLSEQSKWNLIKESKQSYLNDLLINLHVFKYMFGKTKGEIELSESKDKQIQEALRVSAQVFNEHKQEIPVITKPEDIQNQIRITNYFNTKTNSVCRIRHNNYLPIKLAIEREKAFEMGNVQRSEHDISEIKKIVGIDLIANKKAGNDHSVYYALEKKIQNEKDLAVLETSIYRSIVASSPFGLFTETQTDMQNKIGVFDYESCVEGGSQIKMIPESFDIKSSIQQVTQRYIDTFERKAPSKWNSIVQGFFHSQNVSELLRQDLEENPTSIRNALLVNPDLEQAKFACAGIHAIQNAYTLKKFVTNVAVIGSYATIPFGGFVPRVIGGTLLSVIAVDSFQDIRHSSRLEENVQQAILASQIPSLDAQYILWNIQNQQPWSYVNLAISGLGAAASLLRAAELTNIHPEITGRSSLPTTPKEKIDFPKSGYAYSYYGTVSNSPKGSSGGSSAQTIPTYFTQGKLSEFVSPKVSGSIANPKDFVNLAAANTSDKFSLSNLSKASTYAAIKKYQTIDTDRLSQPNANFWTPWKKKPIKEEEQKVEEPKKISTDSQEYNESDSDFVKLRKALSGYPQYEDWLKEEAEKCAAGESKFSKDICEVIEAIVSKNSGSKVFAIYLDGMTFEKTKDEAESVSDPLGTKYITFMLPNGLILIFYIPTTDWKQHSDFYNEIINKWGNMKFLGGGFMKIIGSDFMFLSYSGSLQKKLGRSEPQDNAEAIEKELIDWARAYFSN